VISSAIVACVMYSILTVKPNPHGGLLFVAFLTFGFPAAIATLFIIEDNWRRKRK
jgi:hypothetical protein